MSLDGICNAQTICKLLSGAWRAETSPPDITQEALARACPLILSTGAGPLIWRRIENTPELDNSDAGIVLRQSRQLTALRAQMLLETLERISEILEAANIVPVIFKGWSVAQYYAEPDLRPFGDIDLCAPPDLYFQTAEHLSKHAIKLPEKDATAQFVPGKKTTVFKLDCGLPGNVTQIDLHRDLRRFRSDPLETIYARSLLVTVKNQKIRILAPEDHLRILCLHFLDHGGWRPIWLCDIAAVLESLPDDFDWDLCLGDNPLTRHWVEIAISLACQLLSADFKTGPKLPKLPGWLVPEVMKQWSRPFDAYMPRTRYSQVLLHYPNEIFAEMVARWPDPIKAICATRSRFDDRPRWPYQATEFARRAFSFLGARKMH